MADGDRTPTPRDDTPTPRVGASTPRVEVVDAPALAAGALTGHDGVVWAWRSDGQQMNVNVVRLGPGGTLGEHVNDEVDVVLHALDGEGTLVVDGEAAALAPGVVSCVGRGARREVRAGARGLVYTTTHVRRGGPSIGRRH